MSVPLRGKACLHVTIRTKLGKMRCVRPLAGKSLSALVSNRQKTYHNKSVRPLAGKRLSAQLMGRWSTTPPLCVRPLAGKRLSAQQRIERMEENMTNMCPSPCGEKVVCTPYPETLTQRGFLRQNASTSFSCSIIQGLLRII